VQQVILLEATGRAQKLRGVNVCPSTCLQIILLLLPPEVVVEAVHVHPIEMPNVLCEVCPAPHCILRMHFYSSGRDGMTVIVCPDICQMSWMTFFLFLLMRHTYPAGLAKILMRSAIMSKQLRAQMVWCSFPDLSAGNGL